jgi:DNA-binding NtrC family response regulator
MIVLMINEPARYHQELKEFAEAFNIRVYFAHTSEDILDISSKMTIDLIIITFRSFSDISFLKLFSEEHKAKLFLKVHPEIKSVFNALKTSSFEFIDDTNSLKDLQRIIK